MIRNDGAERWSALPTIVALICIAAGGWIQLTTAGFIAFVGAPLYVLEAAVTLFVAYLAGHQSRWRAVPSYLASAALVAAILFQWDTAEPPTSWMRLFTLLGPHTNFEPPMLAREHPMLTNVVVAIPWLIAVIAVFAAVKRDGAPRDQSA